MDKHIVKVYFSLPNMLDFMTQDHTTNVTCIQGLPKDAVLLFINYDHERLEPYAVFEHPSFPAVAPQCVAPELQIRYQNNAK